MVLLKKSMKLEIFAFRSSTEVKLPRRMTLRARIENHISIWLSQDACLGVKWKTMRWLGSRRNFSRVAIDLRMPHLPLRPRSPLKPMASATKRTTASEQWMLRLSITRCQWVSGERVANSLARYCA